MNSTLETLLLPFAGDDPLKVPSRALFLGAQPHRILQDWPEVIGWQPFKPLATAWERAGFTRVDEIPSGKWPLILSLPGKSKEETLFGFSVARDHLEPGGRILVAMPNTAGAGRFEKELATATGGILSIQKNKARAFHAEEDGTWNEEVFDAWRALGKLREIPGSRFSTVAGIFSSDQVDSGSRFLVEHLPAHFRGNVADLGAGWGFLADAILRRCPKVTRLDLFEADSRALACARRNLAIHSPTAEGDPEIPSRETDEPWVHFYWHDVTTGLPGLYDAIVMNPPFHTGQATDVDLGRAFIQVAAASLKRGGKLLLVANRQLPYEAVLSVCGLAWRKIAEDKTFKILSADKR